MSSMPEERLLQKGEVIGHRIVEIRQDYRPSENGLDWAISYFVLDSGVSFTLPMEDADGILAEPLSPEAVALDLDDVALICGQRIVDVLRVLPDSGIFAESLFLLLENEYLLADVMGDYSGTGGAGVHLYKPGEIDRSQLEPIWPENV